MQETGTDGEVMGLEEHEGLRSRSKGSSGSGRIGERSRQTTDVERLAGLAVGNKPVPSALLPLCCISQGSLEMGLIGHCTQRDGRGCL